MSASTFIFLFSYEGVSNAYDFIMNREPKPDPMWSFPHHISELGFQILDALALCTLCIKEASIFLYDKFYILTNIFSVIDSFIILYIFFYGLETQFEVESRGFHECKCSINMGVQFISRQAQLQQKKNNNALRPRFKIYLYSCMCLFCSMYICALCAFLVPRR